MPFRPSTVLYAIWCIVVLATFFHANNDGFAAASSGRPTSHLLASGPRHK